MLIYSLQFNRPNNNIGYQLIIFLKKIQKKEGFLKLM